MLIEIAPELSSFVMHAIHLLYGVLWLKITEARDLTVDTSSGPVTGFINSTTPNVVQFLGVPFAEPPVGERRWLPPAPKSREGSINASAFGLVCPELLSNQPNVWAEDAPEFNVPEGSPTGEDCLTANVWMPRECDGNLPVVVWIYGGGFASGSGNVPYQNPSRWVERSQRHIVVSINYRVNIFGFPNAAGLEDDKQNLGLLDQRLGIEWIKKNIANFGGDPDRITLWGQSSGAMSVDYYNYAYREDPIAKGLILTSGSALVAAGSDNWDHTNFTFVAEHFECGKLAPQAEIECLKKVAWEDIIGFLNERLNAGTVPVLKFLPVNDNVTKFADFTQRTLDGKYSKLPTIIGTNSDEGTPFVQPYDRDNGPNMTLANLATLNLLCSINNITRNRYASGSTTFRYLYAGNFSNISPRWWEGAYHAAQLPMVFGTSGIARGDSTPFEKEVSKKMQDYWLAFAEDPVQGLPRSGWGAWKPDGDAVLLAWKNVTSQPITEARLEAGCDGYFAKPGAIPPPQDEDA